MRRYQSVLTGSARRVACYRVWVDTVSGSLEHRPELTKLLAQLRPGDTLVVWRLDRLGRSIRHLIDQLQALGERDVGFRSLQETIDTTSPGGRLVFHVFAALAEFERDLIRERTHAGLAAARARGRLGGRPSKLSADQVRTARRLYEQRDMTVAQIGNVLGVSRTTVYRALRQDSDPDARTPWHGDREKILYLRKVTTLPLEHSAGTAQPRVNRYLIEHPGAMRGGSLRPGSTYPHRLARRSHSIRHRLGVA